MKKREIFMVTTLSFSLGVALGFLISPVKNGIYNFAGNTTNHYDDKKPAPKSESEE